MGVLLLALEQLLAGCKPLRAASYLVIGHPGLLMRAEHSALRL
jgi:hypothetical protein